MNMIRRIFLGIQEFSSREKRFFLALVLVAILGLGFAQMSPMALLDMANTWTQPQTFIRSVAIGTSGGSATLTLNGAAITGGGGTVTGTGVSPYSLTGNSVFTTAVVDGRTFYLPGAATPPIVQLPTLTSIANVGVFFMDGKPDAGITIFSGSSIWYGSGAQSGTGTTVWANSASGNSNWKVGFIGAVRNGVLVWSETSGGQLTWFTKP